MTMSSRRRYVYFGASSGLESILPGVTTRVLGPPTLEQSNAISKQRATDKDQFWHLQRDRQGFWAKRASLANRGDAAPKPLFPRHVETRRPWDMRWYKDHAQREHAGKLLSLVRQQVDQVNKHTVQLKTAEGPGGEKGV